MDFLLTLETSGIQIMSFKKLGLMNLYPPPKIVYACSLNLTYKFII